jgi:hypothetical protein
LSLYSNIKKSTTTSGASSIGSADHAPDDEKFSTTMKEQNFNFIIDGKHQIMYSTFYSHQKGFAKSRKKEPDNFGHYNSKTRLSNNIFSDRVRRDNMSECRGRKDHEGKTSRSVLHDLVFAQECALLVLFLYLRYEENLGGRAGYPKKILEFMLW